MNADRANRPNGTRPNLPTLVTVQGWPGANSPGWLRLRWAEPRLQKDEGLSHTKRKTQQAEEKGTLKSTSRSTDR